MEMFFSLALKLLPLYLLVFLGYLAGKKLRVDQKSIANLLLFIIAPIVVLNGVITTELTWKVIAIPFGFFLISSAISLTAYIVLRKYWPGTECNILAFSAGAGNIGYFGLPLVLAVLGERALGIAVLIIFGGLLYENTIGFYLVSRSEYTIGKSIKKVLLMPRLHAFAIGVILSLLHIPMPDVFKDVFANVRGAYSVLGMMLVGLGISGVSRASVDTKFILSAFIPKFIVWPLVIVTFILIDLKFLGLYSKDIHAVFLLLSVVPMASNTVAYSSSQDIHPEKTALAVLISTILALVLVPFLYNVLSPVLGF